MNPSQPTSMGNEISRKTIIKGLDVLIRFCRDTGATDTLQLLEGIRDRYLATSTLDPTACGMIESTLSNEPNLPMIEPWIRKSHEAFQPFFDQCLENHIPVEFHIPIPEEVFVLRQMCLALSGQVPNKTDRDLIRLLLIGYAFTVVYQIEYDRKGGPPFEVLVAYDQYITISKDERKEEISKIEVIRHAIGHATIKVSDGETLLINIHQKKNPMPSDEPIIDILAVEPDRFVQESIALIRKIVTDRHYDEQTAVLLSNLATDIEELQEYVQPCTEMPLFCGGMMFFIAVTSVHGKPYQDLETPPKEGEFDPKTYRDYMVKSLGFDPIHIRNAFAHADIRIGNIRFDDTRIDKNLTCVRIYDKDKHKCIGVWSAEDLLRNANDVEILSKVPILTWNIVMLQWFAQHPHHDDRYIASIRTGSGLNISDPHRNPCFISRRHPRPDLGRGVASHPFRSSSSSTSSPAGTGTAGSR